MSVTDSSSTASPRPCRDVEKPRTAAHCGGGQKSLRFSTTSGGEGFSVLGPCTTNPDYAGVTDVAGSALAYPSECASLDCELRLGAVAYEGPSSSFVTFLG